MSAQTPLNKVTVARGRVTLAGEVLARWCEPPEVCLYNPCADRPIPRRVYAHIYHVGYGLAHSYRNIAAAVAAGDQTAINLTNGNPGVVTWFGELVTAGQFAARKLYTLTSLDYTESTRTVSFPPGGPVVIPVGQVTGTGPYALSSTFQRYAASGQGPGASIVFKSCSDGRWPRFPAATVSLSGGNGVAPRGGQWGKDFFLYAHEPFSPYAVWFSATPDDPAGHPYFASFLGFVSRYLNTRIPDDPDVWVVNELGGGYSPVRAAPWAHPLAGSAYDVSGYTDPENFTSWFHAAAPGVWTHLSDGTHLTRFGGEWRILYFSAPHGIYRENYVGSDAGAGPWTLNRASHITGSPLQITLRKVR